MSSPILESWEIPCITSFSQMIFDMLARKVNYEFSKKFETAEIHVFSITMKFLKEWERS